MIRHPFALALAALCAAAPVFPAAAQTADSPNLVLTIFGGYRGGHSLWTLQNQGFAVIDYVGGNLYPDSTRQDTLGLSREVTPSFIAGVTASYFRGRHVGVQAEMVFLSMSLDSRCDLRRYDATDTADINPTLCNSLNGASVPMSAVAFSAGLILRTTPNKSATPYVGLSGGLVTRTRGTIEVSGAFVDNSGFLNDFPMIADDKATRTDLSALLTAGIMVPMGPGYQIRLEGRDVYTRLDYVSGLADPTQVPLHPPHTARYGHHLAFVIGLDVVLERKRGRRY
jgi:hypothetical protein